MLPMHCTRNMKKYHVQHVKAIAKSNVDIEGTGSASGLFADIGGLLTASVLRIDFPNSGMQPRKSIT